MNKDVLYIEPEDDITDLTIEINGDMIEGIINLGAKVASEESTVEQVVM